MLKFLKPDSDRTAAAPATHRGPETEAALTDTFEQYRRPHAIRIAEVAEELATIFGFEDTARHDIRQAALLHDVGERQLNLHFLRMERPLTFLERQELWRHPVVGEQFAIQSGYSEAVALLIRWHHENWDGFGYPDGLRGEAIPLAARILRVADAWCALTAERPHRPAYSAIEAAETLKRMAGFELDPLVTARLLAHPDVREMLRAETEPPVEEPIATIEPEIPATVSFTEAIPPSAESVESVEMVDKIETPVIFAEPEFPDARDIHPPAGTVFDTVQELSREPVALPAILPVEYVGPLTPSEPVPLPEITMTETSITELPQPPTPEITPPSSPTELPTPAAPEIEPPSTPTELPSPVTPEIVPSPAEPAYQPAPEIPTPEHAPKEIPDPQIPEIAPEVPNLPSEPMPEIGPDTTPAEVPAPGGDPSWTV